MPSADCRVCCLHRESGSTLSLPRPENNFPKVGSFCFCVPKARPASAGTSLACAPRHLCSHCMNWYSDIITNQKLQNALLLRAARQEIRIASRSLVMSLCRNLSWPVILDHLSFERELWIYWPHSAIKYGPRFIARAVRSCVQWQQVLHLLWYCRLWGLAF